MERIRSIRIALYADIVWTVGESLWDANQRTMPITTNLESYSEHGPLLN